MSLDWCPSLGSHPLLWIPVRSQENQIYIGGPEALGPQAKRRQLSSGRRLQILLQFIACFPRGNLAVISHRNSCNCALSTCYFVPFSKRIALSLDRWTTTACKIDTMCCRSRNISSTFTPWKAHRNGWIWTVVKAKPQRSAEKVIDWNMSRCLLNMDQYQCVVWNLSWWTARISPKIDN